MYCVLYLECLLRDVYVTGFAKTQHNDGRTEIQFIA